MSIRAYKLIKIETEKEPTFNASHDYEILDFAEDRTADVPIFYKENIKEAITAPENQEYKETLQKILKDMGDEDYVEYYMF